MSTREPRQASDIERDIKTLRIETLRDGELNAVTGGSYKDRQESTAAIGNMILGMVSPIRSLG